MKKLRNTPVVFFFLMIRPPPRSTLFPSPTLFRSAVSNGSPISVNFIAGPPSNTASGNLLSATPLSVMADGTSTGTVTVALQDANGNATVDTVDRKSTRLNSSHGYISYAGFCLNKNLTTLKKGRPPFARPTDRPERPCTRVLTSRAPRTDSLLPLPSPSTSPSTAPSPSPSHSNS